ncbi:MAG TPA: alpha-L-arabinofuranosidase C-terminal domain-containing protein, partial [Steroidobacteraceae bacterium]
DEYVNHLKVYARYARNYNTAQPMRRIAVGPDGADTGYTEAVMKAWKNKTWAWDIEGLSLHSYTVVKWPPAFKATGFGESEYAAILKATLNMESLVSTHSAVMDQYDPDRKIALVVDEWGAWLAPTPGSPEGFLEQQNSQRDALVAALNLNIFARHAARVRAANIAQMVNVLQAMIFTRQEKMVLTPTYHVFHMYVPFQDATLVPLQFEAGSWKSGDVELPRVDAIAARDAAGKLWVALTNLDPGRAARIEFAAGKPVSRAIGQTLVAPKIDSVNSFEAPAVVVPKPYTAKVWGKQVTAELAPASITVIALE